MADKLMFIKRLRPIGIDFWPYHENPIRIDSAPKLLSTHRYITEKGYHYKVNMINNDSILIQLENVCPKSGISFEEIKIDVNDLIKKLDSVIEQNNNFISADVNISYGDLTECNGCLRENKACKSLLSKRPEKVKLKIFFDQKEICKAIDYYKNHSDYKKASMDDKTVVSIPVQPVSSYNKNEKEKESMNQNQMANQMSNFLGFQCGVIENPNIAATALGICFKNEAGNWIKFNTETHQRVDMGNLQVGNLGPLYLIPSRSVEVGTPIMYENEFYYVMDTSEKPKLKLLSVADGVEKTIYPAKNLLGLNFFAKVVALIDAEKLMGGNSEDLLLVMALTGGMNNTGDANNQNQFMNALMLSSALNGGEGGLLDGLTDGSLFSGLGGDDSSGLGKLLPLMALTGGLNSGNGQQNLGGLDMNTFALMSLLNKKGEKKEKNVEKTAAAPSSDFQITPENIQKMIQEAVASICKPAESNGSQAGNNDEKLVEE